MVKYGKRQAAEVTLCISERLRLSSGHHAYGLAARPLRAQIKDATEKNVIDKETTSSDTEKRLISCFVLLRF